MGRWGNGIYESDSALDYFGTISDRLEREIAYWFSPEQVYEGSWWISRVMSPIEVILIFEQNHIGSTVYLSDEKAVLRWREIFLNVWDREWKGGIDPVEMDDYMYRQQHRPAIVAIFNRLESIAHFWATITIKGNNRKANFTPLLSEYSLPYFSTYPSNLIEDLIKDIIYWLSQEKRRETITFYDASEKLPVAVDALGLLGEIYKQSIGVNEKTVNNWRNITLERIRESDQDMTISWETTTDEQYKIIKTTFDRLEAVAHKYPPENFWV